MEIVELWAETRDGLNSTRIDTTQPDPGFPSMGTKPGNALVQHLEVENQIRHLNDRVSESRAAGEARSPSHFCLAASFLAPVH
jgi:hypothetical protein